MPNFFWGDFEYYAMLVNAPVSKHISEIKEQNITLGRFSVYSSKIPYYSGRNPPESAEEWKVLEGGVEGEGRGRFGGGIEKGGGMVQNSFTWAHCHLYPYMGAGCRL